MSTTTLLTLLSDLVRGDADRLDEAARGRALDLALQQYWLDRPVQLVRDVISDGGHLVGLPEGFDPETSRVLAVEVPVGHVPPQLLTADAFRLYQAPAGWQLMLGVNTAVDQPVRVTFTGAGETVPAKDHEALASYAAALLHDQLASALSGSRDSTIRSDAVDHGSKANEYAARARQLRARYHELLGIDPKRAAGASLLVPGHLPPMDGGRRMFHRRGRG